MNKISTAPGSIVSVLGDDVALLAMRVGGRDWVGELAALPNPMGGDLAAFDYGYWLPRAL